jgi:hypothetical protein
MSTITSSGPPPTLATLSEEERAERFAALQERLATVWAAFGANLEGESIVVVPSRELQPGGEPAAQSQAFEERLLFLLLLLREPLLRVIYVTSQPVAPAIVEYYLGLLEGVIPSHARARLHLVAAHDASPRSLTTKLLERPRLLDRIRALIPDTGLCHLVPYSTTSRERDLALALGIPMYAADPRHFHHGTKSGGRALFAAAGVAHPMGVENVHSRSDAVRALAMLRAARPHLEQALVKLDEGAGGKGNALVDLRDLPVPGGPDEGRLLEQRLLSMGCEGGLSVEAFLAHLAAGGIVEERISGRELLSPSVQLRVVPDGTVEILSTHDQVLGGPNGQHYVGCRFPADPAYAGLITAEAEKVGARLAADGLVGRFALDFVVVRDDGGAWHAYAIEVNLRKGGTTHPFLTLQFLTDGAYDPGACSFTAPSGQAKHLVASDELKSPALCGFVLDDLFDTIVRHHLQFHRGRQTGVVFHMLSSLTELGCVGMTAVGDSAEEAEAIFRHAERVLIAEAEASPTSPRVSAPARMAS